MNVTPLCPQDLPWFAIFIVFTFDTRRKKGGPCLWSASSLVSSMDNHIMRHWQNVDTHLGYFIALKNVGPSIHLIVRSSGTP